MSERRPGRPRDIWAGHAIVDAVLELLAECGVAGLTVDAVAARAGVGKATIYRRWGSKEELIFAALASLAEHVPLTDTGSLKGDLIALYRELARKMTSTPVGRILPQLVAEAAVNPAFAREFRVFIDTRRESPREVFRRAIDRGELPADADVEMLVDFFGAPIFMRLLMSGARVDTRHAERAISTLLEGALAPSPENRSRPNR